MFTIYRHSGNQVPQYVSDKVMDSKRKFAKSTMVNNMIEPKYKIL